MQRFFAFQLNGQNAVYNHVRSEAAVKLHVLIEQWNRLLAFNAHS
jgi:hypothetical protein